MEPLDNPVWHALAGPQHTLAETVGGAARYPPDMAPFAALRNSGNAQHWAELGEVVGPANVGLLFGEPLTPPEGWEVAVRYPTVQMVLRRGSGLLSASSTEVVTLGADDTSEMLALVELTDPGPLARRTVELGTYLGVRRDGDLVAMAGERMHLPGHREISAVCTHPSVRGEGLARILVSELIRLIEHDGEAAFLHALRSNRPAIALYEDMGFELRVLNEATAVIAPS